MADASSIFKDGLAGGSAGAVAGPWGIAGGAAIGLLGGLIGYLVDSGHEKEAAAIQKRAQEAYGSVSDAAVRRAAEDVLGPTALAKIETDPAYKSAQTDALAALKDISDSGGFNLQDRATLNDRNTETAQADQRRRQQSLESLASRGQAGGGSEIGMLIAGQQNAANRDSSAGMHAAADARDRALKAISDRASLAGDLHQQDYTEQANRANAQDAIDKFNNMSQYSRANDAYTRQLGQVDRQYGMAGTEAANERAAGAASQRAWQDAASIAGGAVTGIANSANRAAGTPAKNTTSSTPDPGEGWVNGALPPADEPPDPYWNGQDPP